MLMLRSTKAGNTMPVIFEFGMVSVMVLGQWVEHFDGAVSVVGVESAQGVESVDDVRGWSWKEILGRHQRKCGTPKQGRSTV